MHSPAGGFRCDAGPSFAACAGAGPGGSPSVLSVQQMDEVGMPQAEAARSVQGSDRARAFGPSMAQARTWAGAAP